MPSPSGGASEYLEIKHLRKFTSKMSWFQFSNFIVRILQACLMGMIIGIPLTLYLFMLMVSMVFESNQKIVTTRRQFYIFLAIKWTGVLVSLYNFLYLLESTDFESTPDLIYYMDCISISMAGALGGALLARDVYSDYQFYKYRTG